MTSKKLFKKDSKGKMRILALRVDGDTLVQESGLINGKHTINIRQCSPKNVGKVNETTGEEQAIAELQSVVTRKLREGYHETIEEAENNELLLPMLAKKANLVNINYPVYIQPKLDGMRAFGTINGFISRKNKEIPTVSHIVIDKDIVLDGELYAHGLTFQENMKLIKKYREGETEAVKYHVYDLPTADGGFMYRYTKLVELVKDMGNIEVVRTHKVENEEELLEYHTKFISDGFEGTIIRLDNYKYEFNKRSNQLLKLKDFIDEVYEIIDVVPSERLPEQGVVVCRAKDGQVFKCGMKMSHEEREYILLNKRGVIGKLAEVRFFEYTDGGLPRFPVYHGYRLDK